MGLGGVRFKRRAFWVFLGGFLIGLALIHIGQERFVGNSQFLDSVRVERVGSLALDRQGLFGYSLWQRLWPAGLLCLLAAAGIGGAAAFVFLTWCGFCAGAILSVLSLRYGIRGVLLFAGGIVPQVFLLVPAYLMLLEWCVTFRRSGYGKDGRSLGIKASLGRSEEKGMARRERCLLPAFLLLGMGCLAESYINPILLEQIFHLFR